MNISTSTTRFATARPAGYNAFASYSGLAHVEGSEYLAVHDYKPFNLAPRISTYDNATGVQDPVDVDWSATSLGDDLEAISQIDGHEGEFLAVEGSRYQGRTPKMFLLEYAAGKATSKVEFPLPKLPYEVEGLATQELEDGNVLVMVGGRGNGESPEGRLHWAILDPAERTLDWSSSVGLAGMAIAAPESIGDGERAISDLKITEDGSLWAASCVDQGDNGPFTSTIYRVGTMSGNSSNPVNLTLDQPILVQGEKIEALEVNSATGKNFLYGVDNESLGGHLMNVVAPVQGLEGILAA